jgi:hypothetical protein
MGSGEIVLGEGGVLVRYLLGGYFAPVRPLLEGRVGIEAVFEEKLLRRCHAPDPDN